jgi:hypothetical protein
VLLLNNILINMLNGCIGATGNKEFRGKPDLVATKMVEFFKE